MPVRAGSADLNRIWNYNPSSLSSRWFRRAKVFESEDGDALHLNTEIETGPDLSNKITIQDLRRGLTSLREDEVFTRGGRILNIPNEVASCLDTGLKVKMRSNKPLQRSMSEAIQRILDVLPGDSELHAKVKQSYEDSAYVKDLIEVAVDTKDMDEFLHTREKVLQIVADSASLGARLHAFVRPKGE